MHDIRTLKLKQLNEIQPSFILLFTTSYCDVSTSLCEKGLFGKINWHFQGQSNINLKEPI